MTTGFPGVEKKVSYPVRSTVCAPISTYMTESLGETADPTNFTVFVPGLLELYMYGRFYDSGTGPDPPLVRGDLDVGPRGNSPTALTL